MSDTDFIQIIDQKAIFMTFDNSGKTLAILTAIGIHFFDFLSGKLKWILDQEFIEGDTLGFDESDKYFYFSSNNGICLYKDR